MLGKFKTKKVVESVTVGECFKSKREEMGITVHDLGAKLKIKPEYIESIENDDYGNLPPEVYVKGFIRAYAEFVGFDASKMVNMFKREVTVNDKIEKAPKETPKKAKYDSNYPIVTPRVVTVFFSAIIVVVVGYYLWHQISSFSSKPYLLVKSPSENAIVENPEISVEGETEKEVSIEINGQSVYVSADGKFKEIISLQPGRNQITVEAKNRFEKSTKEDIDVVYQKKIDAVPQDYLKNNIEG
ncbi:MAG: helix-turn-helix domain-containing protein [Candidatus Paceibacterota bacterium]|jgi:cytoskeletal protein RodZ